MNYNLTVAWNPMAMSVWRDRELEWRIRDSWPEAGMGSTAIVMRDQFFVTSRKWFSDTGMTK
jgi:hypothetical protein